MILVINTADVEKVFVGLADKEGLVMKKEFLAKYRQAEKLLVEIDKVLKKTKINLKDITGIGVVNGPGPFTALRIGVTTANTLAHVLEVSVVGIKLSEFKNNKQLIKKIQEKMVNAKKGSIVEPFYDKEPNITLKKK